MRTGAAVSWTPNKNWIVSATLDLDRVDSDDASRGQDRARVGAAAKFSF